MREFQILKQEHPVVARPYVIIETYITSDGFRSRICNGRFATKKEADEEVNLKLENRNK